MRERTINIAICDDDIKDCKEIKKLCNNYVLGQDINFDIKEFNKGDDFLEDNKNYDIIILDVNMSGKDGFEVAEEIKKRNQEIYIIYLSNHNERMQEAFNVKAFTYLLKPCNEKELHDVLDSILIELFYNRIIVIEYDGKMKAVNIEQDIYHIYAIGDETCIYFKNNNYIKSNKSLKRWEEELSNAFFRCHKSHIINFCKLKSYGEAIKKNGRKTFVWEVTLENNIKIPISHRNRMKLQKELKVFLLKRAKSMPIHNNS